MKTTQDLKRLNRNFSGIYRAVVENNIDPLNGLRVQARVHPMMFGTKFKVADIPWAHPCYPLLTGAESGGGWQVVPDIGSHVWVMFEGGDIRHPVYLGEAFRPAVKHSEFTGVNKRVFKFKSGITITVDETAKTIKLVTANNLYLNIKDTDKIIDLSHPAGAQIYIDAVGNVTIKGTTVSINP